MTGSQPGPCPQDKALGVKTVPCPYLTPILPHAQPLKPGDTSATVRCHTSLAQSPPTVAKHKARPTCPRTLARPPDGPTLGARRQADPGGPTRGTEGGAPEPPMTGALLQPCGHPGLSPAEDASPARPRRGPPHAGGSSGRRVRPHAGRHTGRRPAVHCLGPRGGVPCRLPGLLQTPPAYPSHGQDVGSHRQPTLPVPCKWVS